MEVDLSEVPSAVRVEMDRIFREDFNGKLVAALERQRRAAAFYRAMEPHAVDGIGELKMVVDPFLHGMYRSVYGQRCFEDPEWVEYFLKHSPEARVRSTGTRVQVGPGTGVSGRTVKRWDEAGQRVKSS